MKRCTRCGLAKPLVEFAWQRGKRRSICNPCAAADKRARYAENPEKYRRSSLDFAKRNQDKVSARMKQWRIDNHDHCLAYNKAHNQERRLEQRAYDKKRRAAPGWNHQQWKKYRHQINGVKARRRARVLNAPVVELFDRRTIIERDNSTCYLCHRILADAEITLDHVVPLTRGGIHTAENLRVACRPCNSRKGTRLLEEME